MHSKSSILRYGRLDFLIIYKLLKGSSLTCLFGSAISSGSVYEAMMTGNYVFAGVSFQPGTSVDAGSLLHPRCIVSVKGLAYA